jgi:hypothetical protein
VETRRIRLLQPREAKLPPEVARRELRRILLGVLRTGDIRRRIRIADALNAAGLVLFLIPRLDAPSRLLSPEAGLVAAVSKTHAGSLGKCAPLLEAPIAGTGPNRIREAERTVG